MAIQCLRAIAEHEQLPLEDLISLEALDGPAKDFLGVLGFLWGGGPDLRKQPGNVCCFFLCWKKWGGANLEVRDLIKCYWVRYSKVDGKGKFSQCVLIPSAFPKIRFPLI